MLQSYAGDKNVDDWELGIFGLSATLVVAIIVWMDVDCDVNNRWGCQVDGQIPAKS